MDEENVGNQEDSVEEVDTREALSEPSAEDQEHDGAQGTEGEITDEELLHHCRCQIADGHMEWLCDRKIYRDRLANLLKKEPVIELEAKSLLNE